MAIKGPKKFSPEELKKLQEMQNKITDLSFQFGRIQISKLNLEKQEEILKNMLVTLNKEVADMAKKLTDKYGKGNLDLETGEFIPID